MVKPTSPDIVSALSNALPEIFHSRQKLLLDNNSLRNDLAAYINSDLKLAELINKEYDKDPGLQNAFDSQSTQARALVLIRFLAAQGLLSATDIGDAASSFWDSHVKTDTKKYNLTDGEKKWLTESTLQDDLSHAQKLGDPGSEDKGTGDKSGGAQQDPDPHRDPAFATQRGIGPVDKYGMPSRGATVNVGGGLLDTTIARVGADDPEGRVQGSDKIGTGPQSVESARKIYRASLPVAGSDAVAMDEEDNLQSDALFEAFSWVPDGYGLGSKNRLHNLNRQNDNIRYGIESLYDPRREQEYANPHTIPQQFADDRGARQLISDFTQKVRKKREGDNTTEGVRKKPLMIFDDVYHKDASDQGLPTSRYPVWSKPVIKTKRGFNPTIRPPELSHFKVVDKAKFSYQSI